MSFKIFIKEKKIEIGVLLIILNFAIGIVAKIPFFELIANPSDFKQHPMYYLSAIIVYIFSWVLLFIGILLIGEETINAIKKKMQRKMKKTYDKHVGQHVEKHVNVPMKKFVKKVGKKSKQLYAQGQEKIATMQENMEREKKKRKKKIM